MWQFVRATPLKELYSSNTLSCSSESESEYLKMKCTMQMSRLLSIYWIVTNYSTGRSAMLKWVIREAIQLKTLLNPSWELDWPSESIRTCRTGLQRITGTTYSLEWISMLHVILMQIMRNRLWYSVKKGCWNRTICWTHSSSSELKRKQVHVIYEGKMSYIQRFS